MTQVYDRHVLVFADSHSAGTLKSDAIVVPFPPKILQKLITLLETEPF